MEFFVILETRPVVSGYLKDLFHDEPWVELVTHDAGHDFFRREDLDAILFTPALAYEVYGVDTTDWRIDEHLGRPVRVRDGNIGSTRASPVHYAPTVIPWAVSLPSFAARLRAAGEDSEDLETEPEDPLLTGDHMVYVQFLQLFERIDEWNAKGLDPRIDRLGCDFETVLCSSDREEQVGGTATAIIRAYHEYQGGLRL
jgi:hypothetical protein